MVEIKDEEEDDAEKAASEKPAAVVQASLSGDLVYLTSAGETVVLPSQPTTTKETNTHAKAEQDDAQLTELMNAVIATGDRVAAAVLELQTDPISPGVGSAHNPLSLGDSYVEAMRPLQFGKQLETTVISPLFIFVNIHFFFSFLSFQTRFHSPKRQMTIMFISEFHSTTLGGWRVPLLPQPVLLERED